MSSSEGGRLRPATSTSQHHILPRAATPGIFSCVCAVGTECQHRLRARVLAPRSSLCSRQNKVNVVLAAVVLTVILNVAAVWRAAEGATGGAPPVQPRAATPAGGACRPWAEAGLPLWLAAASAATSLIAWAVFASSALDAQAFYGSQSAYPGGSEVLYGPGYALMLAATAASAGAAAASVRAATEGARSGDVDYSRISGEGAEAAAGARRRDLRRADAAATGTAVSGGGRATAAARVARGDDSDDEA